MAHVVVITHRFDRFWRKKSEPPGRTSGYMLFDILEELERRGHTFSVARGSSAKLRGDAAILHVNATVVPDDYLEYGRRFPLCLNLGAADISKRKVSGARLLPGESWDGPVILKSDLNYHGIPEKRLNARARRAGQAEPFPGVRLLPEYAFHESMETLPPGALEDPDLSVERFLAEPEPDGYALRFWVFCGAAERCTRYVSPDRMVKGGRTIRRQAVPVPEALRLRRRELGFDYGKFDFVMVGSEAVLLDANKTPARPGNMIRQLAEGAANLTDGFEGLLRGAG